MPTTATLREGRPRREWPRGDKIGLAALIVALVGLPAVYLAVPGISDYVRPKIQRARPEDKGGNTQSQLSAPQAQQPTSVGESHQQQPPPVEPALIFIRSEERRVGKE